MASSQRTQRPAHPRLFNLNSWVPTATLFFSFAFVPALSISVQMPPKERHFITETPRKILDVLMNEFGLDDRTAKRLVDRKKVTCNGIIVPNKADVVCGEVVTFVFEPQSTLTPIFLQDDFALFDKPSGLLMYPTKNRGDRTLLDDVHHLFGPLATHVHRIDKETSGLVLVARHIEADRVLKLLFHDKKVVKNYLVFVEGIFRERKEVDAKLIVQRFHDDLDRAIGDEGKDAFTILEPIEVFEDLNISLIRAIPLTGRTHQIRIHCFHVGHKIVGEPLYGIEPEVRAEYQNKRMDDAMRIRVTGAKRLMLHAHRIKFDYKGETFDVTSPSTFGTREFLEQMIRLERVETI